MNQKEYVVMFFNNNHETVSMGETSILANSPCGAVEAWIDTYGFSCNGYAKVTCENGITFTFEIET